MAHSLPTKHLTLAHWDGHLDLREQDPSGPQPLRACFKTLATERLTGWTIMFWHSFGEEEEGIYTWLKLYMPAVRTPPGLCRHLATPCQK